MPCRLEEEGVIAGLSLGLKQGSALQKVPGEEACPDSAQHGGATKTTPLVGLGGASPNLTIATEWEMSLSHSQKGQRKCSSFPEGGDKCTLEDNGVHPGPSSSPPFATAVQQNPARRGQAVSSCPYNPLPTSNLQVPVAWSCPQPLGCQEPCICMLAPTVSDPKWRNTLKSQDLNFVDRSGCNWTIKCYSRILHREQAPIF